MNAPQMNMISKTGAICKALLALMGQIQEINILYNGSPNWDSLITDQEIATVPSFVAAGLTAQMVADAIYQLNAVHTQVTTGNYPAVVLLANV